MKLFNTLTNRKEEFTPITKGKVNLFVCGPTVYDYSHIGHARTYVAFDAIVKYLRSAGYEVFYLQNITDIDDKIIERAKRDGKKPLDLAKEYEKTYLEDTKKIKIDGVSKYARATDYIPQIIKQVKTLLDRGCAYLIENDGYYFDLSKFPEYGKLSGRTMEKAEDAVTRIDESVDKRNKGDFALWKFSKPGEPAWSFKDGQYLEIAASLPAEALAKAGRPGWHIEDTAISESFFGPQYDMHGGARDLIFPHHEAEIAQQESASGKKPFVKYWLHTGFLTISGQKMSKSLGNFTTIREMLEKYTAEAIRMFLLSGHYRTPLDYNEKQMAQYRAAVHRIYEFKEKLERADGKGSDEMKEYVEGACPELVEGARGEFQSAMEDDFNTPKAIAAIFDLIRTINPLLAANSVSKKEAAETISFLEETNEILGIIPSEKEKVPKEVEELAVKREKLRGEKNWAEADKIRAQIQSLGYEIEDTSYGALVLKR